MGQSVWTIGIYRNHYWLLILGRFILGLGLPSLIVAISCLITKWFAGKELAFALGVNTGFSKVGAAIVGVVIPPLIEATSEGFASVFGVIMCGVALLACVANVLLDKYSDEIDGAPESI